MIDNEMRNMVKAVSFLIYIVVTFLWIITDGFFNFYFLPFAAIVILNGYILIKN